MGAGLTLQAIGLAWIAAVATPTTPYVQFVGPFLIKRSPRIERRRGRRPGPFVTACTCVSCSDSEDAGAVPIPFLAAVW